MAGGPVVQSRAPKPVLHVPDVRVQHHVINGEGVTDEHVMALYAGRSAVVAASVELVLNSRRASVDEDKIIEQSRSAHQVGFGQFTGKSNQSPKRELQQAVALKPFKRAEDALDEVSGYLTLAELGVETFEPIGVFPVKGGRHFVSVTRKRNDLTSLDRDRWLIGRQVVDEDSLELADHNTQTIKGIADTLSYINSEAVFHPDGQIKNYAKTPTGEIGVIDTENLIKTSFEDPDVVEFAWQNIEKLVKSLIYKTHDKEDAHLLGVGMLYGLPISTVRASIEELVVIPYLEGLEHRLEGADPVKSEYLNTLYEGVHDRFYSDEAWPSYFIEGSRQQA